jgi:glutamate-ammonia-ligase adenylyltransferase
LYEQKVLKPNEHRLLSEGYLFLRKLDHRLRLERDQSIDAFEADTGRLEGIALALGYGSANTAQRRTKNPGAKLLEEYRSKRERIRACYEHYFVSSQFDEIN